LMLMPHNANRAVVWLWWSTTAKVPRTNSTSSTFLLLLLHISVIYTFTNLWTSMSSKLAWLCSQAPNLIFSQSFLCTPCSNNYKKQFAKRKIRNVIVILF
jgi:hypothetical protein